jgi:hypothetical protein
MSSSLSLKLLSFAVKMPHWRRFTIFFFYSFLKATKEYQSIRLVAGGISKRVRERKYLQLYDISRKSQTYKIERVRNCMLSFHFAFLSAQCGVEGVE